MKPISISFLICGLLAPVVAIGQEPVGPPPAGNPPAGPGIPERRGGGGKHEPGRPFVEAWKAADLNADGFISTDEFSVLPRLKELDEAKRGNLFKRLDKDADGRLSRDELGRLGKPQGNGDHPPMQRLWEMDADKSGGVSLAEFKAGKLQSKLPEEKQVALFQRLDTDKDGLITPKDRPEPPFKRDGRGGEFQRRPGMPDGPRQGGGQGRMDFKWMLRQLDRDADGTLSFDEFRAGPMVKNLTEDEQEDRFESMDRNHDKQLSREDFPAAPPREGGEPQRGRPDMDGMRPPVDGVDGRPPQPPQP